MECTLVSALVAASLWVKEEMKPSRSYPRPQAIQSSLIVDAQPGWHAGAVGLYQPKNRLIVLRDSWDCRKTHDQGILVHEMVHYYQHMKGRNYCQRHDCEAEAYRLQNKFTKARTAVHVEVKVEQLFPRRLR